MPARRTRRPDGAPAGIDHALERVIAGTAHYPHARRAAGSERLRRAVTCRTGRVPARRPARCPLWSYLEPPGSAGPAHSARSCRRPVSRRSSVRHPAARSRGVRATCDAILRRRSGSCGCRSWREGAVRPRRAMPVRQRVANSRATDLPQSRGYGQPKRERLPDVWPYVDRIRSLATRIGCRGPGAVGSPAGVSPTTSRRGSKDAGRLSGAARVGRISGPPRGGTRGRIACRRRRASK